MPEDAEGAGTHVRKGRECARRSVHDLLNEKERLRALATTLGSENAQLRDERLGLQARLLTAQEELDRVREEQGSLQRRLAALEAEHQQVSRQCESIEQQHSDLAHLYVASYRLHATLDRKEVLTVIQEIIINLIGCEELAIFERMGGSSRLALVASYGIDPEQYRAVSLGSGPIGQAGLTGDAYVAAPARRSGSRRSPGEADLTACIPLKLDGAVTGVIALFRLLPQKPRLEALDHELCGLLATHAAVALYCTALHAARV